MVDWQDPAVVAAETDALLKLTNVLVGIYYWEFLISLDFEWSFIRGQRKFKWPMIVYFLNRYCLLVSFTTWLYVSDVPLQQTPTNCHAIYHFLEIIGNMCAAFSSLILALRTMAIWVDNLCIKGFIILLILGQWVILLQGDSIQADWVRGTGCVFTATGNHILAAFFIYTMCLDFGILFLTAWKLVRPAFWRFSPLAQLLFQDGLVYFILVFFSNFVVAVFEILNLNTVMNIMFNAPSVLVATIAATRAVRHLHYHVQREQEARTLSFGILAPLSFSRTVGSRIRSTLRFARSDSTNGEDFADIPLQSRVPTTRVEEQASREIDANSQLESQTFQKATPHVLEGTSM